MEIVEIPDVYNVMLYNNTIIIIYIPRDEGNPCAVTNLGQADPLIRFTTAGSLAGCQLLTPLSAGPRTGWPGAAWSPG